MAREIFSFVKVHRDETDAGMISVLMAVSSIVCLLLLIAVSFAGGGTLPSVAGAIGYLSFVIAVWSFSIAWELRHDHEAYGRMVDSAIYAASAAVIVHLAVFLTGCFVSLQ